ncbi:hypothetical protein [Amycolatopsis sp.]|uniref:hypothetical protein n=1 Tax=Amycolatopsis sp. TaxID=37632 RepID=UPI002E02D954|nr:hypothetical protein [Amycolatopsis sp.]
METNAYLVFLLIGVLLVVADGQVIYRSGKRYLEGSYGDPSAGASMARMVTVLFHLAVLGLLALLSTINLGGSSIQGVVGRLGVMLLVLAIAHALTIGILSRIRDAQVDETIVTSRAVANDQARPGSGPATTPVPGQSQSGPVVSPALDYQAPYSTPER